MTTAPKRRRFDFLTRLSFALMIWHTMRKEHDPDARGTMFEFEKIRKRKAELDKKFHLDRPKRRWFWPFS